MKTRAIASVLLLSFLPIAVNTPAWAQAADDEITKEARERFKEGVALFDKGNYESARLKFTQAYALKKHPAVLLNLAQSNLKGNHALEASKLFQQYLREATGITPEQKADAEKGLAEARAKLGHVEVTGAAGTEVFLENDRLGVLPINDPVDVDPGTYNFKGTKDGNTETVKVTVGAGAKSQARFADKSPAPLPPVAVVPVAPLSTAPPPQTPPPATTPPDDEKSAKFSTKNLLKPPANMLPVYIGGGVGGAGILLAVVFGIAKSSAQDSANTVEQNIRASAKRDGKGGVNGAGICVAPPTTQYSDACHTYQDNVDKVNTDATLGNVSLVVGIVGLAAAAGWYLFAPKKDAATGKITQPVVSPYYTGSEQGVTVLGRF